MEKLQINNFFITKMEMPIPPTYELLRTTAFTVLRTGELITRLYIGEQILNVFDGFRFFYLNNNNNIQYI